MADSRKASATGIEQIEQARNQKKWTTKASAWCDAAGVSTSTLDRFRRQKPISLENFVAICKAVGINNWKEIADLTHSNPQALRPSFFNYDERTWTGRDEVVNDLLPKLTGKTRILWLTGMSGIGKTALGECLANQVWERNSSFQWISLGILEGQNKDFASVAAELLDKLGDRNLSPQELNDSEQLAKRLLQKLQDYPYWIQLDSLERLLNPKQPTEFIDTYWTTFLQRCLTASNFASRLVLTAQAFPSVLDEFVDRYSQEVWKEVRLGGLSKVDAGDERLEFFAKHGLSVKESNQDTLIRIAQTYEGHPLVLKVIAEEILDKDKFAGDVLHYWQENQREFEQVARELQMARLDETEYNEALDRRVRERIRRSLEQLSGDALDLLCRSSVFRRPVPKKFWLAMIGDHTSQQKAAYRVLGDRDLVKQEDIHQGQFLIGQNNLIRDIAYDLLRQDSSIWESAERKAVEMWLTAYQPSADASRLERVRDYLEAFHHFCSIQDWEGAKRIFHYRLDTPHSHELYGQLGIWGYYQELIELCNQLEGKLTPDMDILCFRYLASSYLHLNNFEEAIKYFQQGIDIAHSIGEQGKEAQIHIELGAVYRQQGKLSEALDCYQEGLAVARQLKDSLSETKALLFSGLIYKCFGDYEKAAKNYRQGLEIARSINNLQWQSNALGSLSEVYSNLENYPDAAKYASEALHMAEEAGDRYVGAWSKKNLAIAQLELGQSGEAQENLRSALDLFKELKDRRGEAEILKNLAEIHQKTGEIELARQECDRALELAIELKIPLQEECQKLKEELETGSKYDGSRILP